MVVADTSRYQIGVKCDYGQQHSHVMNNVVSECYTSDVCCLQVSSELGSIYKDNVLITLVTSSESSLKPRSIRVRRQSESPDGSAQKNVSVGAFMYIHEFTSCKQFCKEPQIACFVM